MSNTVLVVKGCARTGVSAKAALEQEGFNVVCCGIVGGEMRFLHGRRSGLEITSEGSSGIVLGDLSLDADANLAVFDGARIDKLTAREFQLLYALVRNAPRLVTRGEIISVVWRTAAVSNLVDTHLYNMRRKLPAELAARIQSVPGRGFRYLYRGFP